MRRITWAAGLALVTIGLAGCASAEDDPGSDATPSGSPSPTATQSETTSAATTPSPAGPTVEITIDGDDVTPNGATVEAAVGEPVTLAITADAPGELHVHSTPDQEVAFGAGSSTHGLTFDRPGVVEVESHDTGKVIVKFQVR